jgi:hypothetical protein
MTLCPYQYTDALRPVWDAVCNGLPAWTLVLPVAGIVAIFWTRGRGLLNG